MRADLSSRLNLYIVPALQALVLLAAFISATAFNGTSDPLLTVFMPLLVLLAGTFFWPGIQEGWSVPRSPVIWLLLSFWAYLAISTLWSTVPYMSHLFVVLIGILPLVMLMLLVQTNSRRALQCCSVAMACGWLGLSVWALLQFYVFPTTRGHRIAGPMLDPNNMATLFNMALLPAAACFLAARKKLLAFAAFAAYLLVFAALQVTMSRAGFFISIACLGLLAALEWRSLIRPFWKIPALLLGPVPVWLTVNIQSNNLYQNSFHQLVQKENNPSVLDRLSLWRSGFRMLKAHPWGDIGLGDFYYFYPAYRAPTDMSDGFFVHCDPLQMTLEAGWPVAILFYAFLAAVLARTLRALIVLPQGSPARLIMTGSFAGLLSMALHSHINYDLYMPGILIPIGFLMAIWYGASEQGGLDDRILLRLKSPKGRQAARFVLPLVILIAVSWPLRAGLTSYALNKADQLTAVGKDAEADQMADRIALWGIRDNFSIYEFQARLAMKLYNQGAASDSDIEKANKLRAGMAAVQLARRYNPAFTSFMSLEAQFYYLGNGLAFADGREQAKILLIDAVAKNPLDVDARQGLALIYENDGRYNDALTVLKEGTQWPRPKGQPDISFLLALANAYKLTGDAQNAEGTLNFAAQQAQSYGMTVNH
jgi:O-antigen ligase